MKKLFFFNIVISSLFLSSVFLFSCDSSDKKDQCGDNFLDYGEECDSEKLGGHFCQDKGYYGGTLSCNSDCTLNYNVCMGHGFCGDGVFQSEYEECDGDKLNFQTCETLGFTGGELKCKYSCVFDTSACEGTSVLCSNGEIDPGEECDNTNFKDLTCENLGYEGGSLTCTDTCKLDISSCSGDSALCGNGIIDTLEECDSKNTGVYTCESLGYYGGNLKCSFDCTFDISFCGGRCGNGAIDPGEECDGTNFAGNSCETLGYSEGSLSCNSNCTLDTSYCKSSGNCGNGVIDSGETCDSTNFGGLTCEILEYYTGTLACSSDCNSYDVSGCSQYCGDGILQSSFGETCDGTDFGGATCSDFGSTGGTILGCNSDCTINLDGCDDYAWAKHAGGADSDVGNGIAVDSAGNTYITGNFEGIATFGTTTLTSNGSYDIFVVKYDTNGDVVWAKNAGGSSDDYGRGIAVDSAGNTYITGYFSGTATFDSITLTSSENSDIFVAKYDTNGNVVWVKKAGGADSDVGNGIAVDSAGNTLVTGYFFDTVTFDSTSLTSNGYNDTFIVKYNSSGNVIWVKQSSCSDWDGGNGIDVDSSGNVYVIGNFRGTTTFDSFSLTSNGNDDIFVVKYDPNGNVVWAKNAGGPNFELSTGIAVDSDGNTLVTGGFQGTATFDSTSLTSNGSNDIFVVKYDTNGNVVWAKNAGGSNDDQGNGIAVDSADNILVTGNFQGTATFGSTHLISSGSYDIFVAKYNTDGNVVWAKNAGGSDNDVGYGIAVDSTGNTLVTGYFRDTATFDSTSLTSNGSNDIFVTKLNHLLLLP